MIDANDLERMARERPDERFLKGSGILKLTGAIRQLERERDQLRALWLEWLDGAYDGPDLLRRVRLAVHGPLRKPGASGVLAVAPLAWERRQGLRCRDGWSWSTWQPCTEAEAQRVTGLHSWQVRQTGKCPACAGTGRVPSRVQEVPRGK